MADKKENKTGNTGWVQRFLNRPKKPPRYTGYKRVLYYAYIALTIISAIIVVGYIAFNIFSAAPNVYQLGNDDPESTGGPRGTVTRPPQVTTTSIIDDNGNEVEIEIEIPGLPADRKDQFYTFLLVGQDQGGVGGGDGGQTDTMILVAYDVPNQKLSLMSLPRDTWINYRGSTRLLNSVYAAYGAGENGIRHLKNAVRGLTGVNIDFYVMVQWEAIGELVDAIDGVYFEVPFTMYYNDLSQHFKIDLKGGYQLLDGDKAMQLIRYRQNSIGDTGRIDYSYGYREGDIGRIKTQQAFLKAIIKKCLQPEVVLNNLSEYIAIFQKNVATDLASGHIAYFVKSAVGGLNMDDVYFTTLPYADAGDGSHLLPIGSQIVRTVNEHFNPYKNSIQLYELTLADHSPLVTASEDPEESPDPSATPGEEDPEATPGEGDPQMPPGTLDWPTVSPGDSEEPEDSESPRSSTSPRTSESPRSSASPRISESARPTESESGGETPVPTESGGLESPPPTQAAEPSPEPTSEPTPAPVVEPTAVPGGNEEPDLPPGYLG